MSKHLVRCAALALGLSALSAQAAVIGFEGISGDGNPIVTSYSEAGFVFSSSHMHVVAPSIALASNGTQSLVEEAGGLGGPITMTHGGGATFSISSLDAAEVFVGGSAGFPNASILRVVGTLFGGGTVTADLALDGVLDGTGGAADFQHFVLSGFDNLVSVTFSGLLATGGTGGISLDNISTDPGTNVPEPGSLALAGLGLLAAAGLRRTRR
ncbi:MAG: PEP-CTERM sorting domain-containing protein [Burkholderiales bacterium]|nr:PEP-CTERM sorting domain-containing protein [Burkholderiales bacterium]